jgi:hypothetical protein
MTHVRSKDRPSGTKQLVSSRRTTSSIRMRRLGYRLEPFRHLRWRSFCRYARNVGSALNLVIYSPVLQAAHPCHLTLSTTPTTVRILHITRLKDQRQ